MRIRKELSIFLIIALFIGAFLIALNQRGVADITQPTPTPSSSLPSEGEPNKIFTSKNPVASLLQTQPQPPECQGRELMTGPDRAIRSFFQSFRSRACHRANAFYPTLQPLQLNHSLLDY